MLMIMLAVCISLSSLVEPADESMAPVATDFTSPTIFPGPPIYPGTIPQPATPVHAEEKTPTFLAILAALVMPTVCTAFVIPVKYVD